MVLCRNFPICVLLATLLGLQSVHSLVINKQDQLAPVNLNNGNPLRALIYPVYKRTTTEERAAPLVQYLSAPRRAPEVEDVLNADKPQERRVRKKRLLFGMGSYGYGMPLGGYGYNYPYGSGYGAGYGMGYGMDYGYGYGYGGNYGYGYDPYCNW